MKPGSVCLTPLPRPAPQILPEFFRHFWVRRMALDRRNYRALVETTVEVAGKVRRGAAQRRAGAGLRACAALGQGMLGKAFGGAGL
jgi:hypothetical protein